MTEVEQKPTKAPPLPVGGAVMAIVPQSFEEVQRVANTVLASGVTPQALIYRAKDGDDPSMVKARNLAAVASVLMAGAELGIPPMAALRLFTVINGRPALYADGNVAVVRKAKDHDGKRVCAYISSGFQIVLQENGTMDVKSFGWCESRRADTDETHREEFSIEDAITAGLWSPDAMVERDVWEYDQTTRKRRPVKRTVPNDAPWHRYWKRMLIWRATGYCLRWLYADVLGGMIDEFEAREITGMIDITPAAPVAHIPPEPPPMPDAEDEPSVVNAATATEPAHEPGVRSTYLQRLREELDDLDDAESVEMRFDELDVQTTLAGSDAELAAAFKIKAERLAVIARLELEAAGQTSMFPGDDIPAESMQMVKNLGAG